MPKYAHVKCRNPLCGDTYSKEIDNKKYKQLTRDIERDGMTNADGYNDRMMVRCRTCGRVADGTVSIHPDHPMADHREQRWL